MAISDTDIYIVLIIGGIVLILLGGWVGTLIVNWWNKREDAQKDPLTSLDGSAKDPNENS